MTFDHPTPAIKGTPTGEWASTDWIPLSGEWSLGRPKQRSVSGRRTRTRRSWEDPTQCADDRPREPEPLQIKEKGEKGEGTINTNSAWGGLTISNQGLDLPRAPSSG
jgi:hypothetical protein